MTRDEPFAGILANTANETTARDESGRAGTDSRATWEDTA